MRSKQTVCQLKGRRLLSQSTTGIKSSGDKLIIWGVYPDLERSYIKKALDRYEDLTENDLEVVQIPKEEFEKPCRLL